MKMLLSLTFSALVAVLGIGVDRAFSGSDNGIVRDGIDTESNTREGIDTESNTRDGIDTESNTREGIDREHDETGLTDEGIDREGLDKDVERN